MAENQRADVKSSTLRDWGRKSWLPEVLESMSLNRPNAVLRWAPKETSSGDIIGIIYNIIQVFVSRTAAPDPAARHRLSVI